MIDVLAEALIGAVVERALNSALATRGDNDNVEIYADPKAAADSLRDHLLMIEKWSSVISFRDLLRTKQLAKSFVDLECQVGRLTTGGKPIPGFARPVSTLLQDKDHIVLLGGPGAGKTTSLQRLALTALQRYDAQKARTPLLIRLRDLSAEETLLGRLAALSTLRVLQSPTQSTQQIFDPQLLRAFQRRALCSYLKELNAVLFLDGLDECPIRSRPRLERDINEMMEHSLGYNIVLTCRNASYTFLFPAQAYTIRPLNETQVADFAVKWLGVDRAESFTSQLIHSPYKGAEVLPITLAHLCAIFERRGSIPPQPRFIYQKIVRLLLEEWDEQRGIQRTSRYAGFDVDRKLEFLRRIAYELTTAECRGSFSHIQLEQAYLNSYETFGLPKTECSRVAREIESHTGLILEAQNDTYEFAHKSLQEYLTAEYLLRLPEFPAAYLSGLGEELAIAAALSSRAELYVQGVAEAIFQLPISIEVFRFAQVFVGRLVAERPDLTSEEWLGWTLIALCDLAGGHPQFTIKGGYHPERTTNLMVALASNTSFNPSIKSALVNARRFITGTGTVQILPRQVLELPSAIDSYFRYFAGAGVNVQKRVYEAMHDFAARVEPVPTDET